MDIKSLDHQYVANTYNRFPVEIVSGKGSVVVDRDGKEYIDLGTGIAVTDHRETESVGTDAMTEQYLSQYVGKSGTIRSEGDNSVDAVSGATATSEAITACVNQALAIVANLSTEGDVNYVDGEV